MRGIVKKLFSDKGFGFISPDRGPDIFFHASGMARREDFESLQIGQRVTFEEGRGDKGPRATDVRVL